MGSSDGYSVGNTVGASDGYTVGRTVGLGVVGATVGAPLRTVGPKDGDGVGASVVGAEEG